MEKDLTRPVYIIGHKNPDTDSICSALAYAYLKNHLEGGGYIAARAGQLNQETQYVLKMCIRDRRTCRPEAPRGRARMAGGKAGRRTGKGFL